MPLTKEQVEQIGLDCWNRAINCFGTGQIFQKRSQKLTIKLKFLSFMGLVLPLLLGGYVLSYGIDNTEKIKEFIKWAAGIGILQLVISLWSIVFSWADDQQYCLESAAENLELSAKFQELGKLTAAPPEDLEVRYAALKARDESRNSADSKRNVSAKEYRYGHRAGLRQMERKCKGCATIPTSMNSTSCNVCGRF